MLTPCRARGYWVPVTRHCFRVPTRHFRVVSGPSACPTSASWVPRSGRRGTDCCRVLSAAIGGAGLVYPTGTLYTAAPRPPRARSCGFCCRWLNESWARGKQRPPPGRTGGPAGQGSAAQRLRGRGRRWREGVWEPCLPSKAHRSCQLLCGLGLQRCPQGPPGQGQLPARDSGPDRHPALWAFAVLSERRSGSTCVVRPVCV